MTGNKPERLQDTGLFILAPALTRKEAEHGSPAGRLEKRAARTPRRAVPSDRAPAKDT